MKVAFNTADALHCVLCPWDVTVTSSDQASYDAAERDLLTHLQLEHRRGPPLLAKVSLGCRGGVERFEYQGPAWRPADRHWPADIG